MTTTCTQHRACLVLACLWAAGCQSPSTTSDDRLAELAWRPAATGQLGPGPEALNASEPAALADTAGESAGDSAPAPTAQGEAPAVQLAEGLPEPQPALNPSTALPIQDVSFWDDAEPAPAPERPAQTIIPSQIPGADAPPITLPPLDENQPPEEWRREVAERYSPVPSLTLLTLPSEGAPTWTLADLESIAMSEHPALRKAWADVEIARGEALQAGLLPNPTVAYMGDSIGTGGTAGYNGVEVSQTFITAGKLGLAENVECFDVRSAEQKYRRERIDVLTSVRRHYVAALVAEKRSELLATMVDLANEAYQTQIEIVQIREAAPHEPLSLRAIALQLETERLQADRDAESAWRQLAAAAGQPHLTRGHLLGDVAAPAAEFEESFLLGQMLSRHTDLAIADIEISRASADVVLQDARIVPDVDVAAALQHDDTTPVNDLSFNLSIAIPIPIHNQNQGNLFAAEARLSQARSERDDAYRQLLGELAKAYQEYQAAVEITDTYRDEILPDQVRVFRGIADRYRVAGEPSDFAEIVVAQQTLSAGIEDYLDSLQRQWDALVDIAELLQVESLDAIGVSLE